MALDPRIILGGQSPDVVGSMSRGIQTGQQMRQAQTQNALSDIYRTQGAGIMAGDEGALNALAGIDPNAAMTVQSNRLGMDAQRLGMDATRQNMGMQVEQAKQQARAYAQQVGAEQAAKEAAQLESTLKGASFFYSNGDREGYDNFLRQRGADPEEYSFDQFEPIAATIGGVLEALRGFQPETYKPQSPQGKFNADMNAGVVLPGTEFKDGGTTVNNNLGEGSKFYDELDKGAAGMFQTLMSEGVTAGRGLQQVERLGEALAIAPSGAEASFKAALGDFGIATEGLDALQAAEALLSQMVPQQRPAGSGTMSDADLALFKKSLPRLINQPGGNAIIVDRMRGILQYQIQQAEIASRVADRQLTAAQGREALAKLANPLEGIGRQGGQSAPTGAGTVMRFDAEGNMIP